MAESRAHIAVGVIYSRAGKEVLIARRHPHSHQGGLWEFPGGKRRAGEDRYAALCRELEEELGLQVLAAHPLRRFDYDYPDRAVRLDVWAVDDWEGSPRGNEGQTIRWMDAAVLDPAGFPAANERIIRDLDLPEQYFITPDCDDYGTGFLEGLESVLQGGIRMLRLRSSNLAGMQRRRVLEQAAALCGRYGGTLLGSGPADNKVAGIRGLHLDSRALMQLQVRPGDERVWVAASCHNREELQQAGRLGLDFCVLGPVRSTASHPGSTGLGWERFAELADAATLPVYALGGLQPDDLETARRYGAHGVAMISALWNAASD